MKISPYIESTGYGQSHTFKLLILRRRLLLSDSLLEHKIRFRNLSKRYTFTVKKSTSHGWIGREGCAGLVSCLASDASINSMRTRFLDAGKRNLGLINSMLSLSCGLPGRAQEPLERRFRSKRFPCKRKL
jgi:hypothetical protein